MSFIHTDKLDALAEHPRGAFPLVSRGQNVVTRERDVCLLWEYLTIRASSALNIPDRPRG
jgi:hypothetical protein